MENTSLRGIQRTGAESVDTPDCQPEDGLARWSPIAPAVRGMSESELEPERPRTAHAATLDRFLAGVERRALRMAEFATGNREEALDVVQEAMLALAKHYGRRDPDEWPMLFQRILQNRIRDWHRRAALHRRWFSWLGGRDEDDEEAPLERVSGPPTDDPARVHEGHEMSGRIDTALRSLPLRQRQVFLLRAWEGMDVARTAQALGISQGSVKTHHFRALQQLRVLLEGDAP